MITRRASIHPAAAFAIAAVCSSSTSACKSCSEESATKAPSTEAPQKGAVAAAAGAPIAKKPFARYPAIPAPAEPRGGRTATIAPDLGNVSISVLLTAPQRARVAENGFVVSPANTKEFYELYERARYDYIPIFVTSDSLLHVYHLLFDKTLRVLEGKQLLPQLLELDQALYAASRAALDEVKGTPVEDPARRNAAYFAVALKLLSPDWVVPEDLRALVQPELDNIAAHTGPGASAIFPGLEHGEDWSQYVPRGHYTKNEELKRYFLGMMWHGRMTFRAGDDRETLQAALLLAALDRAKTASGKSAGEIWSNIYDPTVFFVGRSDDLTPSEYEAAFRAAYGQIGGLSALADGPKLARFKEEIGKLRAPEILGMVVDRKTENVERATQGLRFMGQRFVPDSFVFRRLIDRNVEGRSLPRALDFFAVLGSDRALAHLETFGETKYPGYSEEMRKLRAIFAGYDEAVFTQNLYWSWIHGLRPLLDPVPQNYPVFMRSPAWLDKQLTTALASWTELKHDTILYAKPVYAEMGGGGIPPPEPEQPKGFVEPVPMVFARVGALATMTRDGLAARGLIADEDKAALTKMEQLAGKLRGWADAQIAGKPLAEADYEAIRFYGGKLEELTFSSGDENVDGPPEGGGGEDLQVAVVADVATDPNGRVLEEGVGRVFEIYAAVPVEGKLVLAKGGVFSHYELEQPISERLDDDKWREMIDGGKTPPLAPWTKSFMVNDVVSQEPAERIMSFTECLLNAVWWRGERPCESFLEEPAKGELDLQVKTLTGERKFIGMKRFGIDFMSFDFRDAEHVTVTSRERWFDELNRGDPVEEELEKLGDRGPYVQNVTYTMVKKGDSWKITNLVRKPDAPPWKMVK